MDDKHKGIPFRKRKENLCSSLCNIERFLCDLNKNLKYVNIFKFLQKHH